MRRCSIQTIVVVFSAYEKLPLSSLLLVLPDQMATPLLGLHLWAGQSRLEHGNTTTERSGFRSDCQPIEAHCENCVTISLFVASATTERATISLALPFVPPTCLETTLLPNCSVPHLAVHLSASFLKRTGKAYRGCCCYFCYQIRSDQIWSDPFQCDSIRFNTIQSKSYSHSNTTSCWIPSTKHSNKFSLSLESRELRMIAEAADREQLPSK